MDPTHFPSAAALERALGDPFDPTNGFSFARAVARDEADEYPEEPCRLLDQWGLHQHYVPTDCGGQLERWDELFALLRTVARRDVATIAAHWTTCLAAVSVWFAGTPAQKRRVAERILRGEQIALGLTERAHGSDLLANEVEAVEEELGYRLNGEKWLINNATRSTALTLYARTDPGGGPRGYSVVVVEKDALAPGSFTCLPREKTLGIRGTDISGIRFEGALIPSDARIPPQGSGLELTLKSFQITRALCASLSLGAADTALRSTLDFALTRRLYGDAVIAIPHARRVLAEAFADLLRCECLSLTAMRTAHTAPEQMSLVAAIVKYLVPTAVHHLIQQLAIVLGARYYLRAGHWSGVFQKILRDNAIVSVFDGSTLVNLDTIALQQRHLAEYGQRLGGRGREEMEARLVDTVSLQHPLPVFDPTRLVLLNRGRNDMVQGLAAARDRLHGLTCAAPPKSTTLPTLLALVDFLVEELNALDAAVTAPQAGGNRTVGRSKEAFDLAARYCELHSAAVCLHVWLHNRDSIGGFFEEGEWLTLCLDRALGHSRREREPVDPSVIENISAELTRRFEANELFSILPFGLAPSPGRGDSAALSS